jgi:hypothetical protein
VIHPAKRARRAASRHAGVGATSVRQTPSTIAFITILHCQVTTAS